MAEAGSAKQAPSVGRVVHYIDREVAVHHANVNRRRELAGQKPDIPIEPFGARITRVHGADVVSLAVDHPELGYQIVREVPYSDEYAAGHWSWPPYVPPAKGKK